MLQPREEEKGSSKKNYASGRRKSSDDLGSAKPLSNKANSKGVKRSLSSSSDGPKSEKILRRASFESNGVSGEKKKQRPLKTEPPAAGMSNGTAVKLEPEVASEDEHSDVQDDDSSKGSLLVKSSFR